MHVNRSAYFIYVHGIEKQSGIAILWIIIIGVAGAVDAIIAWSLYLYDTPEINPHLYKNYIILFHFRSFEIRYGVYIRLGSYKEQIERVLHSIYSVFI